MSGLESLAIAASVLQIADLAANLSLKLFEFSRKTSNADKSVEFVSKDIKSTGIVLHQLAIELSKDEARAICSRMAIDKTEELINSCREVFHELEQILDAEASSDKTVWSLKRRLKFSFLEPHIELLRSNLDRLRSSLTLMVQIQQRKLMQSLLDDLKRNQENFERLQHLFGQRVLDSGYESSVTSVVASVSSGRIQHPLEHFRPSPDRERSATAGSATIISRRQLDEGNLGVNSLIASAEPSSAHTQCIAMSAAPNMYHNAKPVTPQDEWSQLVEHCTLVRNILFEIKDQKYRLDHILRDRISKSVHHSHWLEWNHHREHVGDQRLLQTLNNFHSELTEYWESQIQRERLAREDMQRSQEAGKEPERVLRAAREEQEFRPAGRQQQMLRRAAIEDQEHLPGRGRWERVCLDAKGETVKARHDSRPSVRTPTDVMRARRDRKKADKEQKIQLHEQVSPQRQARSPQVILPENGGYGAPKHHTERPIRAKSSVSEIAPNPSVIQGPIGGIQYGLSYWPYNGTLSESQDACQSMADESDWVLEMPTRNAKIDADRHIHFPDAARSRPSERSHIKKATLNRHLSRDVSIGELDAVDELVLRWTKISSRDLLNLKNEALVLGGLR